jgi:hypothetical protein
MSSRPSSSGARPTYRQFPAHRDERGELVVVEGAELDFPVRRVFTVSGTDALTIGNDGATEHHELTSPGESVTVGAEDHVSYQLDGARSVIVVLCDEAHRERR